MERQISVRDSPPSSLSKLFDGWRMFVAGGCAGAAARTATAPLDRIKILFQVQAVPTSGTTATAYTGVGQAAMKILREEGVVALWKGNSVLILRVFPYSASQLMANDQYKRLLAKDGDALTVEQRLLAGACAGMTASALTHPLDTVRLRLALPGNNYTGPLNAVSSMVRTEGVRSLYKGLMPTLVGVAPYAALNFASYDLLKNWFYHGNKPQGVISNLALGSLAGSVAASFCYPLDTVRRRMQMKGTMYTGQWNALVTIWTKEGLRGFYRGYAANLLKVVPQNAIRFVTYETMKNMLGVAKAKTDT